MDSNAYDLGFAIIKAYCLASGKWSNPDSEVLEQISILLKKTIDVDDFMTGIVASLNKEKLYNPKDDIK